MKKLLFVGAEAMPFAATGGLGDVLGSLPSAIIEAGKGEVDVRVVLPLYRAVSDAWRAQMTKVYEGEISLAWRRQYCGIYSLVKDGVTYYFVDNKYYFDRETLDRKSTRLNSSHDRQSRMPSSAWIGRAHV